MTAALPVLETSFGDLTLVRRGKVRDVYAVDAHHFLIVATDRLSAFDCILPTPIARKGEVLTALSEFWFGHLGSVAINHMVTTDVDHMPEQLHKHRSLLQGRSMLVRKADVFPVECVVRGYVAGSGWKDYLRSGEICGHSLPVGLREAEQLPEPIFTPATKAESGHDENISEAEMSALLGVEITARLRGLSLALYRTARDYARQRGIIIADTKFEFGTDADGNIMLIDEALTPDSSRFWPADEYQAGRAQRSFDKQYVRDYLETLDWDKCPPAPALPAVVAAATTERYLEAYRLLTGKDL